MSKTIRIGLVALVGALSFGGHSDAAPGGCTNDQWLTPFAFETLTVSSTALGFTAAVAFPAGGPKAALAVVTTETDDVRYRADGLNPTAAVGHLLDAPGVVTACGENSIRTVRFIRTTTDATLSVSYYQRGN